MPKFLALIVALTSAAQAEIALWTATGSLTTGTGVFLRDDLSPGDPVTIRVTFNDQATPEMRDEAVGRVESDYRTDIDLRITITSGTNLWEGMVPSAATISPTTFATVTNIYSLAERVDFGINSTNNGTFPTFPFRLGESNAAIQLSFLGANNSFLGSGISPTDIDPTELSTATGSISTGVGNALAFTIDPTSLEVIFEDDEIVPPFAAPLTISTTAENVMVSWQSDFRFRYRVESTADLSSNLWTEIETRFGTDAIITRTYPLTDQFLFYRTVALVRTPPAE